MIRSNADVVAGKLARVSRVSSAVGEFVEMVGGLAKVNLLGATVDIRCDGFSPPIAGMPVRVETVDGIMRVVGPSRTLSPRGEVTAVGAGSTTVTVDDTWTLPVLNSYSSPTSGDMVVIDWGTGYVTGEEATEPTPETPNEVAVQPKRFKDLLIKPTASGKYDSNYSNWWGGSEVWASNNNEGIWVYGGRHRALAGADITKVEIYLPLIQQAGVAKIGYHNYSTIPGGAPTISSLQTLNDRSGWVSLPTSWGNDFRDNTSRGVGVSTDGGSGFNKWYGAGRKLSGALRFAGTR